MPADLLIHNACLLPDPGTGKPIQPGHVLIRQGRVAALGPGPGPETSAEVRRLDARGGLVMPGLVNAHCHAAMTLFRGLADDLALMDWLRDHIFPAEEAHADADMVYWCTLLAAAEMLLAGITTVADAYFHEEEAARALREAGMRAVAAQGVIGIPGRPSPWDADAGMRYLDATRDRHALVRPALFAHSPYTCTPQVLRDSWRACRDRGLPWFVHAAETRDEAAMLLDPLADSPIRHLHALGLLDRDTVLVHCVAVDGRDLDLIAASGAGVVVCPRSNAKLASGQAPLDAMLERDIPVALGTDGPASNNVLDIFLEMGAAARQQRLCHGGAARAPAPALLNAATRGGARVLGLADCGRLAPGMAADLIVLDRYAPRLCPLHSPGHLVHAADGSLVRHVFVRGRQVVRERFLANIDLDQVRQQVESRAARLART